MVSVLGHSQEARTWLGAEEARGQVLPIANLLCPGNRLHLAAKRRASGWPAEPRHLTQLGRQTKGAACGEEAESGRCRLYRGSKAARSCCHAARWCVDGARRRVYQDVGSLCPAGRAAARLYCGGTACQVESA